MNQEGLVLCGASAYEEKYYFNEEKFAKLPEDIKKELRIISILFTQEIGGEFIMEFDEDGSLQLKTMAKDSDYNYDEIGGTLMIKQIRKERQEMFGQLELFCKVVIMGIPLEEA
ncbi:MAG: DUF6145 family protein [Lachnospiraceae bacterium]|nr:DUF6145 family protein [Lachnospiraceae bacterium]